MKRLFALCLCLITVFSLCACEENPGKNGDSTDFTEATAATAPDGRTVYSEEPIIEYPQTGEYKETALLTNVPGQGEPLLLDMRKDGTIDYIFGSTYDRLEMDLFKENGVQYYTIAPDGTAQRHSDGWIDQIDNYLESVSTAANIENGKWKFIFSAEEGTVLILAQFGPNRYVINKIVHSVMFKLQNGELTIVPLNYRIEVDGDPVDLKTSLLSGMVIENGHILIERALSDVNNFESLAYVAYRLDGTLTDLKTADRQDGVPEDNGYGSSVFYVDAEGMIQTDPNNAFIAPTEPYTEDDSLYALGKYTDNGISREFLKMKAHCGNGSFCCWLDEAGQGVLMRYDYNPEGAIAPEVVTVWSLEHNPIIQTAVVQWNHTHASPIFRYETGEAEMEGTHLTQEDILTRLNMELLNNRGPDVLILDGLNVDNYLDFTVPLDQVNTAGVYGSLLDRFTVDGELLALPTRTVPYLLGRVTEDTQKIKSLEHFADLITASSDVLNVRDADDGMPHPKALFYIRNYNQLFRLWYPAWSDTFWEGGKLNRAAFTEFLTQTTRVVDHYTLTEPQENWGIVKPTGSEALDTAFDPVFTETDIFYSYYMQPPYTLAAPDYVGLGAYWYFDTSSNNTGKAIPHYIESIPGPDGSGIMTPRLIAGVRAGGNEVAGQEFVQNLLSREMQLGWAYHYSYDDITGYPVIWEHTEALIHRYEERKRLECAVQNSFEDTVANLRTVVIDEYLFEAALAAAQCCYRTENRLTPEEAADILEETTRIYLAELR